MAQRMTVLEAAEVLGVGPDADLPDIQLAYRRLARDTHPDTSPEVPQSVRNEAAERFDRIVRARDVLVARKPVVAIKVDPVGWQPRAGGIGTSLALLAILAFLLLAIVSLDDAYRMDPVGDQPGQSQPAGEPSSR